MKLAGISRTRMLQHGAHNGVAVLEDEHGVKVDLNVVLCLLASLCHLPLIATRIRHQVRPLAPGTFAADGSA